MFGEAGNDTLTGGVGDDIIYGGDGSDDSGSDTVDYTNALETLTITLDTNLGIDNEFGTYDAVGLSDGASGDQGQGDDILYGIENVIGSNYEADIVNGSNVDNTITTQAGDDTITGYGGADVIDAGIGDDVIIANAIDDGSDVINGGTGSDTLDYEAITSAIDVDLAIADTNATLSIAGGDSDTVQNVENILSGSANDTLSGNSEANTIVGNAGDDTISGESGIDKLYGDAIDGTGSGNDTVSYTYATSSVNINLAAETAYINVTDNDIISSFENAIGGSANDTLTGSDVANTLIGKDGDDTFIGNDGNDVFYGGDDVADNSSNDIVDYTSQARIITTLSEGGTVTVGTSGETDTVYGIENIKGSNSGDDTIIGSNVDNTIWGQAGNDTLKGADGADKLDGGTGDDLFIIDVDGQENGDEIIGGDNYDTVNYQGLSTSGVNIDLGASTVVTVTHEGSSHTITEIEHIIGTDQTDILTGDNNYNNFQGMDGNDTLDGKAGDDQLFGGDGLDLLYGGDGKDTLYGEADADTLEGEAGNDTLYGGAANDTINGGLGADTLMGEAGDDLFVFEQADNSIDVIYGGDDTTDSGTDTVDYSQAIKGMTVTLGDGDAQGTATSADQGTDSLYGIENIIGSNLEGDTITGNNETNTLSGMGGDDILYGADGADTLLGGADDDTLYGEADSDSLDGGIGDDTLIGGADVDTMIGGAGDDIFTLTRDDGLDIIDGETDNDTLDYSAITTTVDPSNDGVIVTLDGTNQTTVVIDSTDQDLISNIENVIGTGNNDTFTGDAGVNTLVGGAGTDEVRYDYDNGSGVIVDLEAGTATETGGIVDTLSQIENVVGSSYDDTFVTQSGVSNTIDGGAHTNGDMIDYSSRANAIDVTLNTSTATTVNISGDSNDSIVNIEHVTGSSVNDTITGDSAVNTLLGMAGNDTLSGAAGSDYLDGGAGNDTLIGGADADTLLGGIGNDIFTGTDFTGDEINGDTTAGNSGIDTVDYSSLDTTGMSDGVVVDLTQSDVQVDVNLTNHTITNIENIIGSDINDEITGDDNVNTLAGNDGADTIYAAGEADTIYGDDGIDELHGGDGNDVIYGDDSLNSAGMSNADTLYGDVGNDTLYGGYGDDTFFGGLGTDIFDGGDGSDTADYTGEADDIIANVSTSGSGSSIGIDLYTSIENITGGLGDDTLTGDGNANTLIGSSGTDYITEGAGNDNVQGGDDDDTLIAGAGDDIIDGGANSIGGIGDTIDYNALSLVGSGITIDLSDTNAQLIHATYGTDTITNIENIIGSNNDDVIQGNDSDNILEGRSGDDSLVGGDGADKLIGGAGTDTIDYSVGTPTQGIIVDMSVTQTDGDDTTYRVQNDGFGNAEFIDGVENIIGTDFDDIIYGDEKANSISAGGGDDTLRGGLEADILDGGTNGVIGDTVDFSDLVGYAVTVDLDTNDITGDGSDGTAVSNGKIDTIRNIEHIIGTKFDDTITGDHNANSIIGGDGTDTLRFDYANVDAVNGIEVDLSQATASRVADDGFGNTEYIDQIENIIGSNLVDTIIGDSSANKLEGLDGADSLFGNEGNDTLIGGDNADTFRGGLGDDIIYGNAENPSSTDAFRDVVDYSQSLSGITLNLSTATSYTLGNETVTAFAAQTATGEGTDRLYDIQDVVGSNLTDTLIGNDEVNTIAAGSNADLIIGAGGADIIYGEAGNDTILGGLDGDTIYGGDNIADSGDADWADYSYITTTDGTQLTIDLTDTAKEVQDSSDANIYDDLIDIENVKGGANDDILTGEDDFTSVNTLDGYKGDDTFYASKGVDHIIGGDGTDTLDYSTVDIAGDGNRVIVDLGDGFAYDDGYQDGGIAVVDTISSIEIVIGTTSDDTLYGSSFANTLIGDAGNDNIDGREGDDLLSGGDDNDTIDGGDGTDIVNGEDGDDTLSGGEGNDTIDGGTGADLITFDLGNDSITGGAGSDHLTYSASADYGITVTLEDGTGTVEVDVDGTDTLLDHIETISGSNLDDVITGYNGADTGGDYNDTLYGLGGNDTIYSGIGNDVIDAGAGTDLINGQAGDDTIDGGTGTDTLTFAGANQGVEIHLDAIDETRSATTNNVEVLEDGFGGQDQLTSIENIIGSIHDDTFGGDGSDNSIYGGDGNDTFYLSAGDDTLDGGTGNDWISNQKLDSSLSLTNRSGTNQNTTLTNIDNILDIDESVTGTVATNDRYFWGNDNTNSMILYGGNDRAIGYNGDDIYDLGDGNDIVYAATGNDTIIGGNGTDQVDYRNWIGSNQGIVFDAENTSSIDVDIDLDGSTDLTATFYEVTNDGRGYTDYIYQVENFIGDNYNDIIKFDDNANYINSVEGNDTVWGRGGADIIYAGSGADIVYGGNAEDVDGSGTIDGENSADTIFGQDGNDMLFGEAGNDTIDGGNNDDTIYGGDGDDRLLGGNDDDIIYDGDGNDVIYGEANDDTIYNSVGVDTIDGGTHDVGDTLYFQGVDANANGILVDLSSTTNNARDLYDNTETIINIEHIIATDNNDTITGSSYANTLIMGAGDDTVYASEGDDNLSGGSGIDLIDFSGITTTSNIGVHIDLNTQNNAVFETVTNNYNQSINGFENVIGTSADDIIQGTNDPAVGNTIYGGDGFDSIIGWAGNDSLYGENDDDTILGGEGDDIIDGGENDDTLNGGLGDDSLIGGNGIDTITFEDSSGGVKVNIDASTVQGGIAVNSATGEGSDTLSSIENIIGSDYVDTLYGNALDNSIHGGIDTDTIYGMDGADTINGGADADYIDGGAGDDSLYGDSGDDFFVTNAGADTIDGGSEIDIVDYSTIAEAIDITLVAAGTDIVADGATDRIINIEGIIATAQADTIIGDDQNNVFEGRANNDTLRGNAGDDTIDGGADNDTISGGSGDDTLIGGDGTDWLDFSQSDSGLATSITVSLRGGTATGDGSDTLSGFEHIQMGDGTNIVEGSELFNSIVGGSGTDTLSYATTTDNMTINITGSGSGSVVGDGNDVFENIENYIGSNQTDTLTNDSVDGLVFDGLNSSDTMDYTTLATAVMVDIDNTNAITINDGANTDTLSNVENIISGSGDDTFNYTGSTNVETLDAGAGTDTLALSGTVDLSGVTLLNFEKIVVPDGEVATISATNLDAPASFEIELQGSGSLIVDATNDANDHDFDNITITKTGAATGTATLNVDATVDLSAKNLNDLFDIYDIDASAILTLDTTQVDDQTLSIIGAGDLIIEATATPSDHNFDNLTNNGTSDITLDINASLDLSAIDFGDVNRFDIAASQTLTLQSNQINGTSIILTGAGTVQVDASVIDSTIDLSSVVNDSFTGNFLVNDGSSDNMITIDDINATVNLTTGDDNLTLGNSTNIINISATNLTTADAIDATAGSNDTMNITTAGTVDLTNVNDVETINLSDGINTVTVGATTQTINGGSGVDTFNIAKANLSSTDDIDGAGGNDVINITDIGGIYSDADFTNITSIETLNLSNTGNDTITLGDTNIAATGISQVNARGGNDTITIIDTTGLTSVDGGTAATDTLNINADSMNFGSTTITNFEIINVNGDVDLSGNIDANVDAINIADGKTLTVNSSDINDKTIALDSNSTGEVIIVLDTLTNLSNVTDNGSGNITLDINSSVDLSGVNFGPINGFDIAASQTLTLSSSQLTGTTRIIGDGDIVLNISGNSDVDLSSINNDLFNGEITINDGTGNNTIIGSDKVDNINMTSTGTDTVDAAAGADTIRISKVLSSINGGADNDTLEIASGSTIDLSASTLTSIETVTIETGATLTISDEQAANITTINGAGTIEVNIDSDSSVDLSHMNASFKVVNVTASSDFTGTFAAGTTIEISDGATLTANYSIIDGFTVNKTNSTGTVEIEIDSANSDADLSTVIGNANKLATITQAQTFTGNLNSIVTTINAVSVVAAADLVTGETINQIGGGTLEVTISDAVGQNDADLTTINGDAFTTASVIETLTFTGTLDDTVATTVSNGVTLTVADTIMESKSIIGAGSTVITMSTGVNTVDLTSVNVTGTETVRFTGTTNFTSGNFADTDVIEITSGTLTLNGSQLNDQTLQGAGDITVNASGTLNLSSVTNNLAGTLTINDSAGNDNITGTSGAETINLTVGGTDVVDAGAGIDTINVSHNTASINGGDDNDTLNVTSTVSVGTLSNVEILDIQATNTMTAWDLTDVNSLDVNNNDNGVSINATMTLTQYTTLGSANITRGIDDQITLTNVTGDISGTNLSDATAIVLSGNTTLSALQATQFGSDVTKNGHTVTLSDNGTNISNADFSTFSSVVDSVNVTDDNIVITKTQVDELIANAISFDSGDNVTLSATGAQIAAYNFADLESVGVDIVDASDDTLNISFAQATGNLAFTAADTVTIVDSSVNLNTSTDFTTINTNVDGINATDAITIDISQKNYLDSRGISFDSGDDLSLTDTTNVDTFTLDSFDYTSIDLGLGDDILNVDGNNLSSADVIDGGAGTNTFNITANGTLTDLDFTNISNFDTLNLSSGNDDITLGTEIIDAGFADDINGLGGDDNFTLDFSNIGSFSLDGGANSDIITLNGSSTINSDSIFGDTADFSNMETIDLTGMSLTNNADASDGGVNAEFLLDGAMIEAWDNDSTSLVLKLNSGDASKFELIDVDDGKVGGDDSDTTGALVDGHTYTLDTGSGIVDLTIDLV